MPPSRRRPEKVMALIPAYNEEKSIAAVIEGIHAILPQADVVVIDDSSTDHTVRAATTAGAFVVRLPCNLGIGGAVQTGLKFARIYGYDLVVRLDGDGQHDPNSIPALFTAVATHRADVAIGSRFIDDNHGMEIPLSRRLGIKTYATLVSLLTRQHATDTTSGFMCLNRKAIHILADYLPQDYPEVEGRVILHKAGLTTLELPANMQERVAGLSSINSWRSIYYAFKVSIAVLICAMKDVPLIEKEPDYGSDTPNSTHRRYRHQSYALVGDSPTDPEA